MTATESTPMIRSRERAAMDRGIAPSGMPIADRPQHRAGDQREREGQLLENTRRHAAIAEDIGAEVARNDAVRRNE